MSLTLEQVRHVATLARLALSPQEEERTRQQLSAILHAMEALSEVDTQNVEPTAHPFAAGGHLRVDLARPSLEPKEALANAPEPVETSFGVPKVIE